MSVEAETLVPNRTDWRTRVRILWAEPKTWWTNAVTFPDDFTFAPDR